MRRLAWHLHGRQRCLDQLDHQLSNTGYRTPAICTTLGETASCDDSLDQAADTQTGRGGVRIDFASATTDLEPIRTNAVFAQPCVSTCACCMNTGEVSGSHRCMERASCYCRPMDRTWKQFMHIRGFFLGVVCEVTRQMQVAVLAGPAWPNSTALLMHGHAAWIITACSTDASRWVTCVRETVIIGLCSRFVHRRRSRPRAKP